MASFMCDVMATVNLSFQERVLVLSPTELSIYDIISFEESVKIDKILTDAYYGYFLPNLNFGEIYPEFRNRLLDYDLTGLTKYVRINRLLRNFMLHHDYVEMYAPYYGAPLIQHHRFRIEAVLEIDRARKFLFEIFNVVGEKSAPGVLAPIRKLYQLLDAQVDLGTLSLDLNGQLPGPVLNFTLGNGENAYNGLFDNETLNYFIWTIHGDPTPRERFVYEFKRIVLRHALIPMRIVNHWQDQVWRPPTGVDEYGNLVGCGIGVKRAYDDFVETEYECVAIACESMQM